MASSVTYVGYVVAGVMTISCIRNIKEGFVKEDFQVFKGVPRNEWLRLAVVCPLLIAALFSFYYTVSEFIHGKLGEILQFSWLTLLSTPEEKVHGTNLIVSAGSSIPYFGVVFLGLLFLNLPGMARSEEEMFREGTKSWKDGIPRSLGFGLVHCAVGVPVAIGLALAIPGLWFTHEYFKGGVERSTRVHAFYNMIMMPVLAFFVIQATLHK